MDGLETMRALETLVGRLIADRLVLILILFSSGLEVKVSTRPWQDRFVVTYVVLGLLVFVALLVGGGLLLIWLTLLLAQGLPFVTKDLANLTCMGS